MVNPPACRRAWLEGVVLVSVLGLYLFLCSLAVRFCFVWIKVTPPSPSTGTTTTTPPTTAATTTTTTTSTTTATTPMPTPTPAPTPLLLYSFLPSSRSTTLVVAVANDREQGENRERKEREKREKRERKEREKREKREREKRENRERTEREKREKRERKEREQREKREWFQSPPSPPPHPSSPSGGAHQPLGSTCGSGHEIIRKGGPRGTTLRCFFFLLFLILIIPPPTPYPLLTPLLGPLTLLPHLGSILLSLPWCCLCTRAPVFWRLPRQLLPLSPSRWWISSWACSSLPWASCHSWRCHKTFLPTPPPGNLNHQYPWGCWW